MASRERVLLDGPDGKIELFIDIPDQVQGVALIAHPHPLFGGTADNKVVTTLAKTFLDKNCVTLRPSFRGVGASEGEHDHGVKEAADLLAVHDWAKANYGALPMYLAGFSFGAHVITRLAKALVDQGQPAIWLVLVGTAAGFVEGARSYETAAVAADTLVIHGSADTTVRLQNVLDWAEPLGVPVVVVAGAEHFFHRKLHILRDIIHRAWKPHQ